MSNDCTCVVPQPDEQAVCVKCAKFACPYARGVARCPAWRCDCFIDQYPDSPFDLHPEAFVVRAPTLKGQELSVETQIETARAEYFAAQKNLSALVTGACPGEHKPVQYRDGKPPWCKHCGRSGLGQQIKEGRT